MATQVTGIAEIRIDGNVIRALTGATLTLDGNTKEGVYAGGEWLQKSEPKAAEMECKVAHTKDQSIRELADIDNALVIFTTDTDVVFHIRGAWTMEPPQLDSGSGEISLKMSGQAVDEQ